MSTRPKGGIPWPSRGETRQSLHEPLHLRVARFIHSAVPCAVALRNVDEPRLVRPDQGAEWPTLTVSFACHLHNISIGAAQSECGRQ